tara:strand:+ start:273 stop:632 length:360 start_codon:yes stop_codon:yes gene_type:complete
MTIQIDREMFRERVSHSFGKRQHGNVACGVYSEEVYDLAQEWFDKEEWKVNPELDTPKECRIGLKRYIKSKIKTDEEDKAWFVPSFIWIWLSQQVIVFIVRLIIEYYWDDIFQELPTES